MKCVCADVQIYHLVTLSNINTFVNAIVQNVIAIQIDIETATNLSQTVMTIVI